MGERGDWRGLWHGSVPPAITFNLNGLYTLGSMEVWNFAEAASAVALADVQVSLNGTDFNSIGQKTFATPVNPGQNFDLGGVSKRATCDSIFWKTGAGRFFPFTTGTPTGSGFCGRWVRFSSPARRWCPEPRVGGAFLGIGGLAMLLKRRRV